MSFVIRIVAPAMALPNFYKDQFVLSFDVEANAGRGDLRLTKDRDKALRFATAPAALAFWQQSPRCQPLRPDGRPNRPLTAYTIEIEAVLPAC